MEAKISRTPEKHINLKGVESRQHEQDDDGFRGGHCAFIQQLWERRPNFRQRHY